MCCLQKRLRLGSKWNQATNIPLKGSRWTLSIYQELWKDMFQQSRTFTAVETASTFESDLHSFTTYDSCYGSTLYNSCCWVTRLTSYEAATCNTQCECEIKRGILSVGGNMFMGKHFLTEWTLTQPSSDYRRPFTVPQLTFHASPVPWRLLSTVNPRVWACNK